MRVEDYLKEKISDYKLATEAIKILDTAYKSY